MKFVNGFRRSTLTGVPEVPGPGAPTKSMKPFQREEEAGKSVDSSWIGNFGYHPQSGRKKNMRGR